mgnify:CR=1 FL=1
MKVRQNLPIFDKKIHLKYSINVFYTQLAQAVDKLWTLPYTLQHIAAPVLQYLKIVLWMFSAVFL